jgi:CheY-like chemotaxis protein
MKPDVHIEVVPLGILIASGLTADTSRLRPVVLVVDDEPVIADTLVAILRNQGFAANAAYDGASALQFARTIPPQLLISDVVMPGLSGVELAIAITREVADCKVLLFSGQAGSVDLLQEAREKGYDFAILHKPVHPKDLLQRVSELGITSKPAHRSA